MPLILANVTSGILFIEFPRDTGMLVLLEKFQVEYFEY